MKRGVVVSLLAIPATGTKVKVVGSFVLDSEANHRWMKIHPVSKIEAIQ